MKTAAYISTTTATGGSGKYPLSTQALDFIQSQILLLENLSLVGGKRYILKEPDGTSSGIVVIDGEALVLSAKPMRTPSTKYVIVKTEKQNIEADGETYIEARTIRTASYSNDKFGQETYEINSFSSFASNATLESRIKQLPETVLTYLQDVMAEKLSALQISGVTQSQLDSAKTPCIISCQNSITMFGQSNYNLHVKAMGGIVYQELTMPDSTQYVRTFRGAAWSKWDRITENLHIEAKVVRGVVYLRHGQLPPDASVLLLRKKHRSRFRRTGGSHSYSHNVGKRDLRQPKTQYVHFKGIVLSQGEPNKWYVPKCISVADKLVDGSLIDKELSSLCRSLITPVTKQNGLLTYSGFRIQGVRNIVTFGKGKGRQNKGFASIAVQVATHKDNRSKTAGGEMVKMKYRIQKKREKLPDNVIRTTWYRSFSLE